jgi:hypothetical protein
MCNAEIVKVMSISISQPCGGGWFQGFEMSRVAPQKDSMHPSW